MFIRRTSTSTKRKPSVEKYYTYRLCENRRVDGKVKQTILINLGRHFSVPEKHWRLLATRIEHILKRQEQLLPLELSNELERLAQRYASQIIKARSEPIPDEQKMQSVNLNSLEMDRPRQVGVEYVALHAMAQLGLLEWLKTRGFNRHQFAAIVGNLIARMAKPGSERASHAWLQQHSALGELIDYDYEGMGMERLYRASDQLLTHKNALESHLYGAEQSLFSFEDSVTLFDLTNTFFEGTASGHPLATRGRSKEKRSDCPIVTVGLVLDGSGFPKKSTIFAGNVSEPKTLSSMLSGLGAHPGMIVIVDAGIATEDNIAWLVSEKYRYLVVSRKQARHFDETTAVTVKQIGDQVVKVQRVVNEQTQEVELYCHSIAREQKERAMQTRQRERYEEGLKNISAGLSKKTGVKKLEKVAERIGRLKQKYSAAAQHYEIKLDTDPNSGHVTSINWTRNEKPNSAATHPGVYCLRTNLKQWDEARLWKTYTMLTDLEAVFRSLKSELGLRPIYHQIEKRIDGHLFISVVAYHLVHTLRTQLKAHDIHESWQSLRCILVAQRRVTTSIKRADGKVVYIRKSSRPEIECQRLYEALGLPLLPGRIQQTII